VSVDFRPFDANCVVGRQLYQGPSAPHTAGDLLAEMDHYGIAEALVVDSLSRLNHPFDGNERVLSACAQSPRLHPAWSALPAAGVDEMSSPEDMLRRMREERVGALFLYPRQYRFSLADWCVDPMLEPLAAAGVPVFINPNDIGSGIHPQWDETDWEAVVALCRRWPSLPVIVSEFRIRRIMRTIYRAFDACPNLRIELSGYWLYRGIEYITRTWGPERLLYGSNWPTFGPHMTLATLTCAEIDDEAKRRIAGDNLRELVSWCGAEHETVWVPPSEDAFVQFGRTGKRPDDMTFADCHGHFGGRFSHYHVPDGTLEGTIAEMDRLGVERILLFNFAGVGSDEVHGNDRVAEALQAHPDRFVGLALLNPHRGQEEMVEELERCAALGFRGIKLIPHYQGYPEEGPNIDAACQWAHDRRQIILNHHWGSSQQVERLVSTYTDACFITGHCTTAYADTMASHPNLFVCSCPLIPPRACEDVVAAIGADRLLFGSDLQDLPVTWGLGPILFARLPEDQKELILGGNLRRILEHYSLRA